MAASDRHERSGQGTRCGGDPAAMAAVARGAPRRDEALRAAAARLRSVGAAASVVEPILGEAVADLAGAMVRHAAAGAALDEWVGAVGTAFAAADGAAPAAAAAVSRRGDHVLVLGDLRAARHVAVVVPGMDAPPVGDAEAITAATHLYDAACGLDPDVAVVAWLDYDRPTARDVLLDGSADRGGRALAAYVAALPRRPGSDVTVVGHSYGTLVVAAALRAGMVVDDVALVGSPGVHARGVGDLPLAGASLYAERAPLDPVALSETFGRDPSDPRFGATRLATGPGAVGHSDYFAEGTAALANLAAVVVQRDDLLVTVDPSAAERAVGVVDDAWRSVADPPLDAAQGALADANALLDRLDDLLPSGPWDGIVHAEHALRDATVEELERAVDVVQRAASPDAVGDVIGDLWDLATG